MRCSYHYAAYRPRKKVNRIYSEKLLFFTGFLGRTARTHGVTLYGDSGVQSPPLLNVVMTAIGSQVHN